MGNIYIRQLSYVSGKEEESLLPASLKYMNIYTFSGTVPDTEKYTSCRRPWTHMVSSEDRLEKRGKIKK